jgi:hypothetical protein
LVLAGILDVVGGRRNRPRALPQDRQEMTSRFERRLGSVEKLRRPVPDPPDLRMFVIATLVGFHCCDRGADEHPLQAYSDAAKGP